MIQVIGSRAALGRTIQPLQKSRLSLRAAGINCPSMLRHLPVESALWPTRTRTANRGEAAHLDPARPVHARLHRPTRGDSGGGRRASTGLDAVGKNSTSSRRAVEIIRMRMLSKR